MNIGDVNTYSYTGEVQAITLPPGRYKFECYGAQGGGSLGGKGGSASGELSIDTYKRIYIYVGQQGINGTGGWNGGGDGAWTGGYNEGFGGGGATDIRIGRTALTNRVLVAPGGGGASDSKYYPGGVGGGLIGGDGMSSGYGIGGIGGTQESGGASGGMLGVGGSTTSYFSGGGGGGYYGGGGGQHSSTGGGGGSSFIGTLENAETTSGVNEGNGYAVITMLGKKTTYYAQLV